MRLFLTAMMAVAALCAWAQQSFIDRYDYRIDYYDNTVCITGVRPGVSIKGELVIPGSFTDPDTGEKYTVTALDHSLPQFGQARPAFQDQKEITSVYIPSTIESIAYGIFTGCKGIKEFKVSSLNKKYKTIDGSLYAIRGEDLDLIRFPPARTSTGFTLPKESRLIRQDAFADNYTVTTLRLSGYQEVSAAALRGNLSITTFELTDSRIYTTDGNFLFDKDFDGHKRIAAVAPRYRMGEKLTLPSDVVAIGSLSGSRASGITIHKGITDIYGYAFSGTSFTSVTIPATVTDFNTYEQFIDCTALESVTIEARCSGLESETFAGCTALREVKLPGSCKYLGPGCFAGCTALESFDGLYRFTELSTSGGQFARSGLRSVNIPTVWEEIPDGMFYGCEQLATVKFNGGVTTVNAYAFAHTAIETLNTSSINGIYFQAFIIPGTLRKIVIPAHEGRMELARYAFTLADTIDLYIDHKEMGDETWPEAFYFNDASKVRIFTSKRSFSHFFDNWKELYVPAGARPHYRNKATTAAAYDNVFEMFSFSGIYPAQSRVEISPSFDWVRITGVSINGVAATAEGNCWRADTPGAERLNVVVSYTAEGVNFSTEYNLSGATSVNEISATPPASPARITVYREASAKEGARYLNLQGTPCHPQEGEICIEL